MAVHPVLHLYASNLAEFDFASVFRSFVRLPVGAGVPWWVLPWRLDSVRAAALVSIPAIVTFGYLPAVAWLRAALVEQIGAAFGVEIIRHRYLAMPVALLWLLWRIRRDRRRTDALVPVLNLGALTLLIVPMLTIGPYAVQSPLSDSEHLEPIRVDVRAPGDVRDIYDLVLDTFPRNDVPMSQSGLDNTRFTDWRKEFTLD